MPQSLSCLLTHIIFSTKDRAPVLTVETRSTLRLPRNGRPEYGTLNLAYGWQLTQSGSSDTGDSSRGHIALQISY